MSNILYQNLMTLCDNREQFFYTDQQHKGATYRIFNYRLVSYTDFLEPDALECRGVMFRLTDGNGVELDTPLLVCRPQPKFFNLFENPFTMDLDLNIDNIKRMEIKADGSLISSFIDVDGQISLKSKGSLHSEQAQAALTLLNKLPKLKDEILSLSLDGYTVNMELCVPYNRIVLNYQQEQLIILNVRNNQTGHIFSRNDFDDQLHKHIKQNWVESAEDIFDLSYDQLITQAKDLNDIEGFIVYLNDGTTFKLKTNWYLTLHRNKDNVDTPRRLFEAAVYETTDDLRSLFHDNPYVLNKIESMEKFASDIYNHLVNSVEQFVEHNRSLIDQDKRKQYALTAKDQLEPYMMRPAMMRYDEIRGNKNKIIDYKEFVVKNWKRWGLKDKKQIDE